MKPIVFVDIEIDPVNNKILDAGGVSSTGATFHSDSPQELAAFIKGAECVCGHNIIRFDYKYISHILEDVGIDGRSIIDTLYLSPLMFPAKPYHALLKDDKIQSDQINNPLADAQKAKDLFSDEVAAFKQTDLRLRQIYYGLLGDTTEFGAFFNYLGYGDGKKDNKNDIKKIQKLVRKKFNNHICDNAKLQPIIEKNPIELAYTLAFINTGDRYSITPPWVLKNYPDIERILYLLLNKPCVSGCNYCDKSLNIYRGLKRFFGFDSFRTFAGEPLQERAVRAAVDNKSLLAIFPTGGGKSVTFQLPALMSGHNVRGLTVVISPLQSLMKDQVDNLEKFGITEAVTINGLLNPVERAKAIERVEDGSASILYISPESLRSRTIEHLLENRNVVRFVIDEAHCFSAWGQDFRVDYLYIGDFIKKLQEKKNLPHKIPVSCFTATARQMVIEDIRTYFKNKLSIELEVFSSSASRTNLHFKVFEKGDKREKYNTLRNLLDSKDCPAIIYVSRTHRAEILAENLRKDGYSARAYHGKMDRHTKTENQDAFIRGEIRIMVATSAFGMGVDKKDVGLVIHYEISDSLENYVQEAGRAGRDESISADCYVLFCENDLDKHFIMLNQTKVTLQEIQQVWQAIKDLTKLRKRVSQSALELARKAGWDGMVEEGEMRVKTAIAALEEAGYIRRGQNVPRIYADGILAGKAAEAIDKINKSQLFNEKQKQHAIRIIKMLISSRSRSKASDDPAESRVDYISDILAIPKEEVVEVINLLREAKLLADCKDLFAFINKKHNRNSSLDLLNIYWKIEQFLLNKFDYQETTYNIKELNEEAEIAGVKGVTAERIRTAVIFWIIRNDILRCGFEYSKNHISVALKPGREEFEKRLQKRHDLARFIVRYLYEKANHGDGSCGFSDDCTTSGNSTFSASDALSGLSMAADLVSEAEKDVLPIEFSVFELKEAYENEPKLIQTKATSSEVEDALFYLSKIGALRLEGGFLVLYNALTIERLERNNKRRYKTSDYKKLEQFYRNKIEQIHIVGEYARKMIEDYDEALQFVEDYFHLNHSSFLKKYFKGRRQEELRNNITPAKYRKLFGELSEFQQKIIKDKSSRCIVVAAGPGSGKTKVLVHKLASLVQMEDVKYEQLLMVTFSRAAATVFKKRLTELIGGAANFIEIKTFHSYCFDLLGRVGTLEKSDEVIKEAVKRIKSGEVEESKITKAVMVIDEAQDMDEHEYELVKALMVRNEDMRVIAVGDDDQNIFQFRGSSSKYMKLLVEERGAAIYELVDNYRSLPNLVEFSNQFATRIINRLKKTPIRSYADYCCVCKSEEAGVVVVSAEGPEETKKINIASAIDHDNDNAEGSSKGTSSKGCGKIKLVKHRGHNIAVPLVNGILAEGLTGTTCVLTFKNDEALQVNGLLNKYGMPSKMIQSNENFRLYNLAEVRYFLSLLIQEGDDTGTIDSEVWERARHGLVEKYENSSNLGLCISMLNEFDQANPKTKYRSDLDVFIRESNAEDFLGDEIETIYVSTIHKAKGREFDNVFLLLDDFKIRSDEEARLLYVAITRAKSKLIIHSNGNEFDFIRSTSYRSAASARASGRNMAGESRAEYFVCCSKCRGGLEKLYDPQIYSTLPELIIQPGFTDVYLDYFKYVQKHVNRAVSGDALTLTADQSGCVDNDGNMILKFSARFRKRLGELRNANYHPVTARVRHILFWRNENMENEILIALPDITLKKLY